MVLSCLNQITLKPRVELILKHNENLCAESITEKKTTTHSNLLGKNTMVKSDMMILCLP